MNVYRFISKDSIEEDIIDRAKRKMVLEYSIITTMDTYGVNVMKNGKKKQASSASADKISSEELQTILKFGAQNLFKQDSNGDGKEDGGAAGGGAEFSKLEEMNLDDILSRAEVHQGVEQSGTALGSAEFLTQFNVADVAQMSWDELIPSDLREEAAPSNDEIPEEFLMDARRRGTAPVSYKGADFSLDAGGGKKKKKATKKKGSEKSLTDKESRSIIKSVLKFGDWKQRLSDIIANCELGEKDSAVISDFIKGAINACQEAIQNHVPDPSSKAKVISVNYGPIGAINSQLLLQRIADMEFLGTRLQNQNLASFRITWQLKPVSNWSVNWGPKEDSMLLVGTFKHGYGSWQQIQDDPDLPFKKKFFLEPLDKALPGSIHLARRVDYLLKAIKDEDGKKPAAAPSAAKNEKNGPSKSGGSGQKRPTPMPSSKQSLQRPSEMEADESEYESMNEEEYKTMFKPIKKTLRALYDPAKVCPEKNELPGFVRSNLISVGSFIRQHLTTLTKEDVKLPKIKKHMWKYASYFWPRVISSRKYRDLCNRMTNEVNASSSAAEKGKPKVSFL